jgi:hypothetical protein
METHAIGPEVMMATDPTVYVVHCVDTEGPIYEPVDATFERVRLLFGIDLPPTRENLKKLQDQTMDLNGKEAEVANCVSRKRLSFLENWHQLDSVLDELFSDAFRNQYRDSYENGYRFNWYCLDHVGFETNPRRRALGYHTILEHYQRWIRETGCKSDRLYWHYHGVPFNRAAHCFGNNWNFSNEHIQVISRRIVDHGFFPCSFRPGGYIERPDINFWLEQWIPFDFGNQAMDLSEKDKQPDFSNGRLGDWRHAPKKWGAYHPDHFNYQIPGNMKRYLFRCLNLESRLGSINRQEVDKAFKTAAKTGKAVLAVTNHDNRDMRDEIKNFYQMMLDSRNDYPGVRFRYANAVDAARMGLELKFQDPLVLDMQWQGSTLNVSANHEIWGPQPFLAVKTRDGRYYHDNMDRQSSTRWSYTFDWMTLDWDALACVGVGSNDDYGNTAVSRWTQVDDRVYTVPSNLPDPELVSIDDIG